MGRWTVFVRLVPIIVEKHTFIPCATVVTCKQQNDRCKVTSSKTRLLECGRDFRAAPKTIYFFKACHEQSMTLRAKFFWFKVWLHKGGELREASEKKNFSKHKCVTCNQK